MAELAPLRCDILSGDYRALQLVWLMSVEDGAVDMDAREPIDGIGPLTPALQSFAEFFGIDENLVAAAARPAASFGPPPAAVERFLRAVPDDEKISLLLRAYDGEPHLAAELRRRVAASSACLIEPVGGRRTAGELRAAAERAAEMRRKRQAQLAAAERRREERRRSEERRKRLAHVASRGEDAWRAVEDSIALRNASGYERAVSLLADLREIALTAGQADQFTRKVAAIRERHRRKGRFVARLDSANIDSRLLASRE